VLHASELSKIARLVAGHGKGVEVHVMWGTAYEDHPILNAAKLNKLMGASVAVDWPTRVRASKPGLMAYMTATKPAVGVPPIEDGRNNAGAGTVRVFRQNSALDDAIGSHTCVFA
jgi:hypothetical protein